MTPVVTICTACGQFIPAGEAVRGRHRECHLQAERVRNNQRQRTEVHQRVINTSRWRHVRDRVRARDGNECQHAGHGYCAGRLEVHHVRKVTADLEGAFDPDNCVLLCQAHHKQLERSAAA
jgi:5-methylcytosine-specific restriction endonuclease McrA